MPSISWYLKYFDLHITVEHTVICLFFATKTILRYDISFDMKHLIRNCTVVSEEAEIVAFANRSCDYFISPRVHPCAN